MLQAQDCEKPTMCIVVMWTRGPVIGRARHQEAGGAQNDYGDLVYTVTDLLTSYRVDVVLSHQQMCPKS